LKLVGSILILLIAASFVAAAPADAKVEQMPECPKFDFDMYSGYLTVNSTKKLHYFLAESKDKPETDPLLLWFNGGPGCSSLLGLMQEHGPCVIDDGETELKENPFPWNVRANVLYIEAPAGVGFSYAETSEDRKFNDLLSSHDNLQAVKDFLKQFPEYADRDLYISGESYAGIYVPYLAMRIHQHNEMAKLNHRQPINLKGIAVGNGATDWKYDTTPSYLPMAYNHQLMDRELYDTLVENNCTWYFRDVLPGNHPKVCQDAYATFNKNTARINWYDIYRPVYDGALFQESVGETTIAGEKRFYKRGYKMTDYAPWLKEQYGDDAPILGDGVSDYLNREDVRDAFHIPSSIQTWQGCAGGDFSYTLQKEGSAWIYPILKANGIKILKFSGDTDGAVPTYGSERWIRDLGWDVKQDWTPWIIDKQVAGYNKFYDGLTFTTIHGVGHMAPQWKRKEVTQLITGFIHGEEW
jgi:carboxypeptidase C (cathepsin A)